MAEKGDVVGGGVRNQREKGKKRKKTCKGKRGTEVNKQKSQLRGVQKTSIGEKISATPHHDVQMVGNRGKRDKREQA